MKNIVLYMDKLIKHFALPICFIHPLSISLSHIFIIQITAFCIVRSTKKERTQLQDTATLFLAVKKKSQKRQKHVEIL